MRPLDRQLARNQFEVVLARAVEILPAVATWSFLALPIILSLTKPLWAAYLIIGYDLLWSTRFLGFAVRLARGYSKMKRVNSVSWQNRLNSLDDISLAIREATDTLNKRSFSFFKRLELKEHQNYLRQLKKSRLQVLDWRKIRHGIIIATLNEPKEIVEETIKSVLNSNYPTKNIWLVIAYEERGGATTKKNAQDLIKHYGHNFGYAKAVEHPHGIAGEIKAKAGNITYAAKHLTKYALTQKTEAEDVLITTLDADNRPDPNYLPLLSFTYATTPNRTRRSYQPMAMFFNNIWYASAPMRIVAAANSFWLLIETTRPHRLRLFSAHAQSLKTLQDTNYWNVRSVVEDGHQFWRTYYRYNGDHKVIPLFTPIYQDAVMAKTFWRTFKAQYKQLRRWAYGVSDLPFIVLSNLHNKKVPWAEKWWHLIRSFEGYFSWATASLILALAGWFPLWLNSAFANQALAHELPMIVSHIHQATISGLLVSAIVSFMSLPPRPAGLPRRRIIGMALQWVLLPVVFIVFHSAGALNAQTRLATGHYLEEFDVTEKAVKK